MPHSFLDSGVSILMLYQQFSVAEESLGRDGKKLPLAWWSLHSFDPYITPRIKNGDSGIRLKSKEGP